MITSDFTGNLGNHLFQYVVTRAIAERKGYEWGFTNYIYGDYFSGKSQMDFLDIDYGKQPVVGIEIDYQENIKYINHGNIVNVHQYHTFDNLKDNSKLVGCWQTEQYFEKEKVQEWMKIKDIEKYSNLNQDENTCVINVRGGHYLGIPDVLLPQSYWNNAVNHMISINPNMKFLVITDDVSYSKRLFPNFPCHHLGINADYYVINNASWLILSNSSFAWFPAWLNKKVKEIIAPKYWAGFNRSDGYWASSNIFTKEWTYLNREGSLQNYASVVDELKNSKYANLYNI